MRAFNSAAAAAVLLAAALIAQPPNAGAALSTVSPGDRIDTPNLCTIGYTYTGRDEHTYAITAGHCATGEGRPVRDQRSGATGVSHFLRNVEGPDSIEKCLAMNNWFVPSPAPMRTRRER
jgi:hypothetical protein